MQKESYVTLCMCRLTLVGTLAKLPQSYWNADSIFFHWSGPSLLPTRLSAVLCWLPLSVSLANSLLWCPLTTSGHAEISSPKPFIWFRAKTDKWIVCLADHLHSVTWRLMPWRNLQKSVVSQFFAHNSSMIWWIVRIQEVVNQLLQKLFRF